MGLMPLFIILFNFIQLADQWAPITAALPPDQKHPGQVDTKPRGVPPQLASFYQESDQFQCLDGKKLIPFEQVNDDYCDCADGSDEPGTSACKNGKFYCPNFGYKPMNIPSSRVNDFICDCCDGSDEWDSGVECPNVCEAQGSQAREEAQKRREVHTAGWAKRLELTKEGQKMLSEQRVKLEQKRKELEEMDELKQSAEQKKTEAEQAEAEAKRVQDEQWEAEKKRKQREEAEQMLLEIDMDSDGKITAAELKKYAGFEQIQDETAQQALEHILKDIYPDDAAALELDALAEKLFKVRDFLTRRKEELEKELDRMKEVEETGTEKHEEKEEVVEDKAAEESEAQPDSSEHEEPSDSGPQYDDATRELIEKADQARKQFGDVERKITDMQDDISGSEKFLEFDYGVDQVWAPLKDKCAELTNTQYTYRICLFDKTVQKDRGGYSEVNLGYWGSWNGPENNKYLSQKYDHGQGCWNGPERSTLVEFECGDEFELVDASEPSKCEYKFVVKVPAVCQNPEEIEHTEL